MAEIDFEPYQQDSSYKLMKGMHVRTYNGTEGTIEATDNYYFSLVGKGYYHRMDIKTILG